MSVKEMNKFQIFFFCSHILVKNDMAQCFAYAQTVERLKKGTHSTEMKRRKIKTATTTTEKKEMNVK